MVYPTCTHCGELLTHEHGDEKDCDLMTPEEGAVERRALSLFVNDREAAFAKRIYRRQCEVEDPYAMNKAIEAVLRVRRESGDPSKTCDYCEHHVDLHYPHPETGEPCCDTDFSPNRFTPQRATKRIHDTPDGGEGEERGLVEKVADEIEPWIDSHGDDERIRGYAIGAARAIIEEVADALEEGIDDRGLRPTTADMWRSASEWLRSQAREDSDE